MKIPLLPIQTLVIFLISLTVGACLSQSGYDSQSWFILSRNFILLTISSFVLYFLCQKIGLTTPTRLEHRIITLLILFLLFDPQTPWWIFLFLGGTTELLQRLFRTPSGPLFNPVASSGLLFSFFNYVPSWWGVSYAPRLFLFENDVSIAMFLTLILGGYVAYRYRKLAIVLAALIAFAVSSFMLFGTIPLFVIVEGTLAFFLLVMAVEPKTSPILRNEQYIYGGIVGILISIGPYTRFPETYLSALIFANLYTHRKFIWNSFVDQKPNVSYKE